VLTQQLEEIANKCIAQEHYGDYIIVESYRVDNILFQFFRQEEMCVGVCVCGFIRMALYCIKNKLPYCRKVIFEFPVEISPVIIISSSVLYRYVLYLSSHP